jgi:tetratricopeptide (TPR) repeat protein
MTDDVTPPEGGAEPPHEENLVPAWLALLVLVLIIAVVGVGGFVVRGMLSNSKEQSPTKADITEFTAAVAADPGDANARLNLAYAYQQDAQYEAALAEYDKVLQQDPKSTAALYNKGVIYMLRGDAKKGESALWQVLKIDPGNALAAKELGEYYVAKGQYKSLLVAVKPVVEAKPTMADLQYLAALGYEKTGKPDLAKEHYRLALKYAPNMQEARDGLRRLGEVAP